MIDNLTNNHPIESENGSDTPQIPNSTGSLTQNLSNSGDGNVIGVNYGSVGATTVENQTNVTNNYYMLPPMAMPQEMLDIYLKYFPQLTALQQHEIEWPDLDHTRFNLFVLQNADYKKRTFCMPHAWSLENGTTEDNRKLYKLLSPRAVDGICHMPCIFFLPY